MNWKKVKDFLFEDIKKEDKENKLTNRPKGRGIDIVNGFIINPTTASGGVSVKNKAKTDAKESSKDDRKTSGLAVASIIFGILGLIVPYIGFLLAILAITLGADSIEKIKKNPKLKGKGLAIAGLILGISGLVMPLFLMGIGLGLMKATFEGVAKTSERDCCTQCVKSGENEEALCSNVTEDFCIDYFIEKPKTLGECKTIVS